MAKRLFEIDLVTFVLLFYNQFIKRNTKTDEEALHVVENLLHSLFTFVNLGNVLPWFFATFVLK